MSLNLFTTINHPLAAHMHSKEGFKDKVLTNLKHKLCKSHKLMLISNFWLALCFLSESETLNDTQITKWKYLFHMYFNR